MDYTMRKFFSNQWSDDPRLVAQISHIQLRMPDTTYRLHASSQNSISQLPVQVLAVRLHVAGQLFSIGKNRSFSCIARSYALHISCILVSLSGSCNPHGLRPRSQHLLQRYAPLLLPLLRPLIISDSIKEAAKVLSVDMLQHYKGNWPGQIPGTLPEPYYWWECGAMFGSLIDYWFYTGDAQHNRLVMQGLQHQVGPNLDFMPLKQKRWGMMISVFGL